MPETDSQKITTAAELGALFRELVAEGVPDWVAARIIRDAAKQQIAEYGFSISKESING